MGRQAVNRVRFSFSERYTNSAFDARPYSITGNEFPKVSNYDERVGANMGGPLKIPHIYDGSNKTFFFANFQHDTQKAGVNTFSTVPTAAERSGNFCGLGVTLYNPFSNLAGPAHSARQRLPDSGDQSSVASASRLHSAAECARANGAELSAAGDDAAQHRQLQHPRAAHDQREVQPQRGLQLQFVAPGHARQRFPIFAGGKPHGARTSISA